MDQNEHFSPFELSSAAINIGVCRFFFLNPAAEIMLNMLFNTLLKMITVVKIIILAGMELEKHRNVHKVSLGLPTNMEAPAVTENRRDYNVRKLLKCPTRTHA